MSEPSMSELARLIGRALDNLSQHLVDLGNEIKEGNRQIRLLCRLTESYERNITEANKRLDRVTRVLEGRDEPWGRPWETPDDGDSD